MNSPKQTTARVLRLSLIAAAMSAASLAHAQDASQMLTMAKQLKAIYQSQQAQSGANQAAQDMNAQGNSSADCNKLMQAKQNAASNFVKNKTPPDPTQVIKNSTCFVDVMDIQIPTTGIGFLDAVVGALGPFVKNQACNATSSWWSDMKSKVSGGQYGTLIGQGFSAAQGGNVNWSAVGQAGGTIIGQQTGIGGSIGGQVGNGNSTTIGSAIGGIVGGTVGNTQSVVVQPANTSSAPANSYLQAISNLRGQLGL